MKNVLSLAAATAAIVVASVAFWNGTTTPAVAQSESFSAPQVKSIEKIIKDYLIQNPEVLLEVQEAYERKIEAKRGEAQKTRIPELYKGLEALKADLAAFTLGEGDVTVVEFFDYNCGFCQRVLPEIVKLHEADKKVKIVFLEYPILSAGSQEAAKVAAAAAKQGKYFEFHREMFAAGRASKDSALKVAEKIGLNMDKVKADMASPETEALIAKIAELGRKTFIDGTPSFVIGDKITPGAVDFEQMKELVDETRKTGCKGCVTDVSGAKDAKKS